MAYKEHDIVTIKNDPADSPIGKYYITRDLDQFRKLKGNRYADLDKRIAKVKASIIEYGDYMLDHPIIVNEDMEVIEGQARVGAVKMLREEGMDIPISYIVSIGAGVRECISLNINSSNWRLTDYIRSYAESGNPDYKRLLTLIEAFPDIPEKVVVRACGLSSGGRANSSIKAGLFEMGQDEYAEATKALLFVQRFIGVKTNAPASFLTAIACCHELPEKIVSDERLLRLLAGKPGREYPQLASITSVPTAMKAIEDIYNTRMRGDFSPIYISYQNMARARRKA